MSTNNFKVEAELNISLLNIISKYLKIFLTYKIHLRHEFMNLYYF